jgi:aspartate aminotransferase
MQSNNTSRRIDKVNKSMTNFMGFFENTAFARRGDDPLACDFAVGNPHEMPLEGYVSALQRWAVPQNKDWFAYKMSEPEAVTPLIKGLYEWRGVRYNPQDILMTTGAFSAISCTLGAIVDPGDEVIFNSPPWFFYEPMIVSYDGVPVRVKVDMQTFDLDVDAIAAAITARTRAIIVNSPNNPTGRVYPPETLRRLAEVLTSGQAKTGRPIYLLSDESYSRIVFDGRRFPSPTEYYPYSFLIYTYGKTLLAPGQRIGYIALPPEMPDREQIRSALFTSLFITGYAYPNALLQHALADLDKLSIDNGHLQEKRDSMVGALQEMGYQLHSPEGTFYLLPRSPIEDDIAFTELLHTHKIFCLPGEVVEMPGYFRISLTANDEMIQRSLPGFAAAMEQARKGN